MDSPRRFQEPVEMLERATPKTTKRTRGRSALLLLVLASACGERLEVGASVEDATTSGPDAELPGADAGGEEDAPRPDAGAASADREVIAGDGDVADAKATADGGAPAQDDGALAPDDGALARDGAPSPDAEPRLDGGTGGDGGLDASRDAFLGDGATPHDAGCTPSARSWDGGGPLPVTNISFVRGSASVVIDFRSVGTVSDVISARFQLEFDNQTGAEETLCVVSASMQGLLSGDPISFAVDPVGFTLRPGRSTWQVEKVPGSTPFDDLAIGAFCAPGLQLALTFSDGQQISTVVLAQCLR
ncbi:MAG: hypothetical protein IT384_29550 [Deltaproteobacteria bacterium]|nr:hypothetical protein [Deltaproteobacteria bacterium]